MAETRYSEEGNRRGASLPRHWMARPYMDATSFVFGKVLIRCGLAAAAEENTQLIREAADWDSLQFPPDLGQPHSIMCWQIYILESLVTQLYASEVCSERRLCAAEIFRYCCIYAVLQHMLCGVKLCSGEISGKFINMKSHISAML